MLPAMPIMAMKMTLMRGSHRGWPRKGPWATLVLLVAPDEPAFFGRSSARAVAAPPTPGEVRPVSSCDEVPAVPN